MSTNTVAPATVTTTPSPDAPGKPDFGNGRYSGLMSEAYRDAIRLTDLSSAKAEDFARQLGSDWGRVKLSVSVKYGNSTKDGAVSLKEVAKAKTTETKAITLARLLDRANELKALAGKSGLLDVTNCDIKLAVNW